MRELEIRLEGPDAERTAGMLKEELAELLGAEPETRPLSPGGPARETRDAATWLAAAGLALAIPGALVGTLDLTQRLQLRRRLAGVRERLLQEEREHGTRTQVVRWDGRVHQLGELTAEELAELFREAADDRGADT